MRFLFFSVTLYCPVTEAKEAEITMKFCKSDFMKLETEDLITDIANNINTYVDSVLTSCLNLVKSRLVTVAIC